jgi:Zn-dependent metalloprotease
MAGNVKGGRSRAFPNSLAIEIGAGDEVDGGTPNPDPRQPSNEIIAHEFGHIRDWVSASDRSGDDRHTKEVQEALADMFAYDYDRDDATLGEHTTGGVAVNWQSPGTETYNGQPQPNHMDDYDPTPPGRLAGDKPDVHFNSTILSHAYYKFVQSIGHDKAGHLLRNVPSLLSPQPIFQQVADAFYSRAGTIDYNKLINIRTHNAFSSVRLTPFSS